MGINKLNLSDSLGLQTIRRCDVSGQMKLTAALLVAGLLLGAIILILGIAYANSIQISSGAALLLVTPIVCVARFNILRLYRIIQTVAPDGETRTASTD
jgi:hypothetical protein